MYQPGRSDRAHYEGRALPLLGGGGGGVGVAEDGFDQLGVVAIELADEPQDFIEGFGAGHSIAFSSALIRRAASPRQVDALQRK